MEKADLSNSLGIGQTQPLSPTPGTTGQASSEAEEHQRRRREGPPEQSQPDEASPDPAEGTAEDQDEDSNQLPHRIDRLA
jgi:hypothetical protein